MSTMLTPGKGKSDLVSMWFDWPLQMYQEWLKMFQPLSPIVPKGPPVNLLAVQEFAVSENDQEMVLVAEAPEFRGNELEARIERDMLNIKGERHEQVDGGELHVSYNRKVKLPPSINAIEAKTTLQDGLVEVRIPKLSASDITDPLSTERVEESIQQLDGEPIAAKPKEKRKPASRKSKSPPRVTAAAKRSKAKTGRKKSPSKRSKR